MESIQSLVKKVSSLNFFKEFSLLSLDFFLEDEKKMEKFFSFFLCYDEVRMNEANKRAANGYVIGVLS